jgi:hypothetical protein
MKLTVSKKDYLKAIAEAEAEAGNAELCAERITLRPFI